MSHGRIDQEVPSWKAPDFQAAPLSGDGLTSPSGTDAEETRAAPPPPRPSERLPTRASTSASAGALAVLPGDVDVVVLRTLAQQDVFRAAAACRALAALARNECLFECLDLRGIGVEASARGRRRVPSETAKLVAIRSFLEQPRFSKVRRLDLRGLHWGADPQARFPVLLEIAGRLCPRVERLALGGATPPSAFCTPSGGLDLRFERRLRANWDFRPFNLELCGQEYALE